MHSPLQRILLIAVFASLQFQLPAHAKTPTKNEKGELAYATFSGQPGPTPDLLQVLLRETRWDNGHWDAFNKQVQKLRFVKVDDQVTPKGTFARYRIFAEGVPENKVYEWRVWLDGEEPKSESEDVYVNLRGLLMTRRPSTEEESSLQVPGAEFYVTPQGVSAEPYRYDLHSRDNQIQATGTLVPKPVFAEDQGCRLEVRLAQPFASSVLFVADGLPIDSKIPIVLESEGESATLTMATDSGGHSIVASFPYVNGKTHGILRATIEGPNCLPSVSLPWQIETKPAQKTP